MTFFDLIWNVLWLILVSAHFGWTTVFEKLSRIRVETTLKFSAKEAT